MEAMGGCDSVVPILVGCLLFDYNQLVENRGLSPVHRFMPVHVPGLPVYAFTNNQAENDLRMIKVQQ